MAGSDLELAREIARFLVERAFELESCGARVRALTDFDVWTFLAGESADFRSVRR